MLGDHGVLLMPTAPHPAPYHKQSYFSPMLLCYTGIFNVLGVPVTQIPLVVAPKTPDSAKNKKKWLVKEDESLPGHARKLDLDSKVPTRLHQRREQREICQGKLPMGLQVIRAGLSFLSKLCVPFFSLTFFYCHKGPSLNARFSWI